MNPVWPRPQTFFCWTLLSVGSIKLEWNGGEFPYRFLLRVFFFHGALPSEQLNLVLFSSAAILAPFPLVPTSRLSFSTELRLLFLTFNMCPPSRGHGQRLERWWPQKFTGDFEMLELRSPPSVPLICFQHPWRVAQLSRVKIPPSPKGSSCRSPNSF